MLRESSQVNEESVNIGAMMEGVQAGHVTDDIDGGYELLMLAEAVAAADNLQLANARDALSARLGVGAMIDAIGVASNFQRMVRIADATGITLGVIESKTADLREHLGINRFAQKPRY